MAVGYNSSGAWFDDPPFQMDDESDAEWCVRRRGRADREAKWIEALGISDENEKRRKERAEAAFKKSTEPTVVDVTLSDVIRFVPTFEGRQILTEYARDTKADARNCSPHGRLPPGWKCVKFDGRAIECEFRHLVRALELSRYIETEKVTISAWNRHATGAGEDED